MIPPASFFPIRRSKDEELRFSIRQVTSWFDRRRFFRSHRHIYHGDPYWIAPATGGEMRLADPAQNRYLEGIEAALFIAESNSSLGLEEPVGTIAALINRDPAGGQAAGHFACFEAINHAGVAAALLEAAEEWILEQEPGITAIRGPASLVPEVAPGLLIDGFNATPAVTTPYNPPYYPELLELAGYEPVATWQAFAVELPGPPAPRDFNSGQHPERSSSDRLGALRNGSDASTLSGGPQQFAARSRRGGPLAAQSPEENGLRVRVLSPDELDAAREQLGELCRAARSSIWGIGGFESLLWPPPEEERSRQAGRLLMLAGSGVVAVGDVGGAWVAAGFALPAAGTAARRLPWFRRWLIRPAPDRIKLLAPLVAPDDRGRGFEWRLVRALLAEAGRRGYRRAELPLVPAGDPEAAEAMHRLGARPARAYAVYEKRFEDGVNEW